MSEKKHPLSALLAQFVGQANVIVIHTHMIKLLDNDHLTALFFEQLCYWSERSKDTDKWIAKTDADWFDELYLGKKQLIRIRSVLIAHDLIETDVRRSKHYGGQPVLHYRVIQEGLEALLTGIPRSAKKELPIETPKGNSYESAETDTSFTETLQETLHINPIADANASAGATDLYEQPSGKVSIDDFQSVKESKNKATPAPRPRNPLFDAIVSAFGYDAERVSKTEGGAIGKVAAELKAVGVEPADVAKLHAYVQSLKFPTFTPAALAKHVSAWRLTIIRNDAPPVVLRDDETLRRQADERAAAHRRDNGQREAF